MPETGQKSAQASAATRDWPAYYDAVAGKGPRETLLDALGRFEKEWGSGEDTGERPVPLATGEEDTGERPVPLGGQAAEGLPLAIDLGCGEGRDTVELLARGWRVLATDAHPDGIARLRQRPECREAESDGRLDIVKASYQETDLPPCRFLNASFSLPFCPPDQFEHLWRRIVASVEPGGRFAGQLFGDRDTWAVLEDRTHLPRSRALALLDDSWVLEHFAEEERPGEDASGFHKHWHVFHIVARKRASESPSTPGETP